MTAIQPRDILDRIDRLARAVRDLQGRAAIPVAAVACTSATRPANPRAGLLIYESDTTRFLIWSGSSWEQKAFATFVCTLASHPASPFQGQEIFETDTGATAVWSGTAWIYRPTQIGTTVLGANAASITINVPAGFTHVQGVFTARQDSGSGGAFCALQLNGDTGSNYVWQYTLGGSASITAAGSGATATSMRIGVIPGSGDTANCFGVGSFTIGNSKSAVFKPVTSNFEAILGTTTSYSGTLGGSWQSTAAVSSVTLLPASGNLVAGSSLTLYGLM